MKRATPLLIDACAALLVLLFLYTAIMKLSDYPDFLDQLQHSPQLHQFAWLISWLIPSAEIATAILLIIPKTKRAGLLLAFVMMLGFSVYVFYVLNYAHEVPCACGGVISGMSWKNHLIFNLIYTGIALLGILLSQNTLLRKRSGKAENL